MTTLTFSPRGLREILAPLSPWVSREYTVPEHMNFVRVFSWGSSTFATATTGRVSAATRSPGSAPGFDCLIHHDDVDRLLHLARIGTEVDKIELTDGDREIMVAAHEPGGGLTLLNGHTRPPRPNVLLAASVTEALAHPAPGPVSLSSEYVAALGESVDCYRRLGEAGAVALTFVVGHKFVVASHLDRFVAVLPATRRDQVPGTGERHIRYGPRRLGGPLKLVDPLTAWPELLQEVPL